MLIFVYIYKVSNKIYNYKQNFLRKLFSYFDIY